MSDIVSDTANIKPKADAPATGRRRTIWPWAWLILEGIATVGWLAAIGWTAVTIVRWLLG